MLCRTNVGTNLPVAWMAPQKPPCRLQFHVVQKPGVKRSHSLLSLSSAGGMTGQPNQRSRNELQFCQADEPVALTVVGFVHAKALDWTFQHQPLSFHLLNSVYYLPY